MMAAKNGEKLKSVFIFLLFWAHLRERERERVEVNVIGRL